MNTTDEVLPDSPGDPDDLYANFPSFVKRTEGRLLALANRIVKDRDEAEDLVNEAYLRLWQVLAEKKGETIPSPIAWLVLVTRRLCIDELRRRRRRAAAGGDPDHVADPGPGPAHQATLNLDMPYLLQLAKDACGETAVSIFEQMKGHNVPAAKLAATFHMSRRQIYHAAETVQFFLRRHLAT